MDNYILAYWQAICTGSVTVGKLVHALYQRIVEGLDSGAYLFDQRKANRAISFIERFAHHNKGPLAPGALQLSLWQKAFLSCLFGIVDPDGCRHFRECFLVVGRKCGKTLLAAGIMLYMTYGDNEYGPEVYCVAPKLDQADLVYSAFRFSVDREPSLSSITRPRKADLFVAQNNGTIKKIAFNERKADGYNPHLTVMDEGASWPGPRGLKQYEVMISGTGARRQPLNLMITSGGYEDEGIYDELYKRSTMVLLGDSRETRLLPVIYQIDDIAKWDDINELRKAMPGLGVSVGAQYMIDQAAIAAQSLSKKAEFLAKYCNLKQNSSQAWLRAEDVRQCVGEPLRLEDFRRHYCVIGVDLSRTTDLTAACALIERGGELYMFAHFWLPEDKLEEATKVDQLPYAAYVARGLLTLSPGNAVDYKQVSDWIIRLYKDHKIYPLKIGYDRYSATYLVQELEGAGLQCDSVFQGENLTSVICDTEAAIKDGKLHIGDNDLLKVHFVDSALRINAQTGRMKLIKLRKTGHIDGMAALLDAMCMRAAHYKEIGKRLQNLPREGSPA